MKVGKIFASLNGYKDAIKAEALYYLSLYYKYWETDDVVQSLATRAYQFKYDGAWLRLQFFLEQEANTPAELEKCYVDNNLGNEFYGNILPLARKLQLVIVEYQDTSKQKPKRVIYPTFHRGYRDHGSRRLPHEYHGEDQRDGSEEEPLDRRKKIFHPLLRDTISGAETEEGEKEKLSLTEFQDRYTPPRTEEGGKNANLSNQASKDPNGPPITPEQGNFNPDPSSEPAQKAGETPERDLRSPESPKEAHRSLERPPRTTAEPSRNGHLSRFRIARVG
jgi:hypothetical protein